MKNKLLSFFCLETHFGDSRYSSIDLETEIPTDDELPPIFENDRENLVEEPLAENPMDEFESKIDATSNRQEFIKDMNYFYSIKGFG